MILINLLPHREAARKKQKEHFYTHLVMSALDHRLPIERLRLPRHTGG